MKLIHLVDIATGTEYVFSATKRDQLIYAKELVLSESAKFAMDRISDGTILHVVTSQYQLLAIYTRPLLGALSKYKERISMNPISNRTPCKEYSLLWGMIANSFDGGPYHAM